MTQTNNPLAKYFRQPAIYIKLPSEGNFYPAGAIDMPPNRELPVYPMTALDEITYRTADALFNGSAVVTVIKSCLPNIKDPWQIPSIDLDAILTAIRIASYGHSMEFESDCPNCQHENAFGLDLRTVLDGIGHPDYGSSVDQGDIKIFFKPLNYQQINANSMEQFTDQKLLDALSNSDLPEEEKIRQLTNTFAKLTDMTIRALSQSISVIQANDSMVVEAEYIEEFIKNCDRDLFNKIRDHIVLLKSASELKPLKIACQNPECGTVYESPFTLDVSNFFASAS